MLCPFKTDDKTVWNDIEWGWCYLAFCYMIKTFYQELANWNAVLFATL